MAYMQFIPIISLIISAGAFLFTILIYRKRRTFENENHFFNYKLEQYGNIIHSASELLELLYKNLNDLKNELEDQKDDDIIDEIEDETEEKMSGFRVILHKGCAFIPKDIVISLDTLYEKILEVQESSNDENPSIRKIEKAINSIEPITNMLEGIINDMRTDMGIENIDTRLKKRAK